MMCSFEAILAWKSDAAAADDRKSDPYMSPSYAGDTKTILNTAVLGHHKDTWPISQTIY